MAEAPISSSAAAPTAARDAHEEPLVDLELELEPQATQNTPITIENQVDAGSSDGFDAPGASRMASSSDAKSPGTQVEDSSAEIGEPQPTAVDMHIPEKHESLESLDAGTINTASPASALSTMAEVTSASADLTSREPEQPAMSQSGATQATNDETLCQQGVHAAPAIADVSDMDKEAPVCPAPPPPALVASPSSLPATLQSNPLQRLVSKIEETQSGNDETQTQLMSRDGQQMLPTAPNPTAQVEPVPQTLCPRPGMQPSAHLQPSPPVESPSAIDQGKSPFPCGDRMREQGRSPRHTSFAATPTQGGTIRDQNFRDDRYPFLVSQNYRSRMGDYYPFKVDFGRSLQVYGSEAADFDAMCRPYRHPDSGQRYSSWTRESNGQPQSYSSQYQGREHALARPCEIPNRRQRYYPDDDRSNITPRPQRFQFQENDDWPAGNGSDSVNRPFGYWQQGQSYQSGNDVSNGIYGPYGGRYYQRKEYVPDNDDELDDTHQPYGSGCHRQGYWSDTECLNGIPPPTSRNDYQRDEFAQSNFQDSCPARYESGYMRRWERVGYAGEEYGAAARVDYPEARPGSPEYSARPAHFDYAQGAQRDGCHDIRSRSQDEDLSDTSQSVLPACAAEEKRSSQQQGAAEPAAKSCESGPLVCDNIVIGDASKVVIGEGNRAGRRCGGRVTGNVVIR